MEYQKYLADVKKMNKQMTLDVACKMFCEKGIESVKMTEIAEKAKLGVVSLYRYYGTKEKLVVLCGIKLWLELADELSNRFSKEEYQELSGYEQIEQLLHIYQYLYAEKKDFIKFVWQFDSFCIQHKVAKNVLIEYEESIHWIYPHFLSAYQKGIEDKSLRAVKDVNKMYITVNHALMSVLEKLLQGEILQTDNFQDDAELKLLSSMILEYIKNKI